MKDLNEALSIFLKYNKSARTWANHKVLGIMGVSEKDVSQEDIKSLKKLGFNWCDSNECFLSKKHGNPNLLI